jgi:putative copper resistance protein D
VAVRREGLFDSFAVVGVDLRAPGLGRGVASTRLTGAFLLAAAFGAAALAWKFARGRRWLVGATAAVGAVALAAAGLSIASRPMPLRNLPNPVAPNEASIASGRALYIEDCLPCHGPTGKGDGPLGLTLNPRPADLTLHTIPGVHPDGQLFAWISDGYPGSVMPAWKGRLSETLRWNLVNYLRTLAPNPAP